MSHLHERSEKICLNCGTTLYDRYCHKCGQENVEPRENFIHLTTHFLEDLTHFDGKFFTTIKHLLLRPGFLTEEYIKGRRASYLNPIRMYLFISAMFFLIYMTFFISKEGIVEVRQTDRANHSQTTDSTVETRRMFKVYTELDSTELLSHESRSTSRNVSFLSSEDGENVAEYDSIQNSLSPTERDGAIQRYIKHRMFKVTEAARQDSDEVMHRFQEKFYHSLPYMLFISLPLVAMVLGLLYVRRRKTFYYVSHVIFTLHVYCAIFLLSLIFLTLRELPGNWRYLCLLPALSILVYIYKAMRYFYKQPRFKTIAKYFLFLFIGSTLIGMLAGIFAFKSFLDAGG